jgi:hypothetical protein
MSRNINKLIPGRKNGDSVSATHRFKKSETENVLSATNRLAHPYRRQRHTYLLTEMVCQSNIINRSKPMTGIILAQYTKHTKFIMVLVIKQRLLPYR